MCWHLIIEEYAPHFIYIKGEHKIVADALSCLDLASTASPTAQLHNQHYLAEHFGLKKEDLLDDSFPVYYKLIAKHQLNDMALCAAVSKLHHEFHLKTFCGGSKKHQLLCWQNKIIIPWTLQE